MAEQDLTPERKIFIGLVEGHSSIKQHRICPFPELHPVNPRHYLYLGVDPVLMPNEPGGEQLVDKEGGGVPVVEYEMVAQPLRPDEERPRLEGGK